MITHHVLRAMSKMMRGTWSAILSFNPENTCPTIHPNRFASNLLKQFI